MKIVQLVFCTLVATLMLIATVNAQVRVVNENGDVIILMPDGTWKYEDPEKEKTRTDKTKPVGEEKTTPPTKEEKKRPRIETKTNEPKPSSNATRSPVPTTKPKSIPSNKVKTSNKAQKKGKAQVYTVPKRKRKVPIAVIPKPVCEFSMKERDEFTNKLKVALEPRRFFGYTSEQLKKYMRGKDYLTCTGHLSRVLGFTVLNVRFEIQSAVAQREYGRIEEGTRMLVKLLNGRTVTLICQESDQGIVDEINGKTIYRTYFSIASGDEKVLTKSEVVRVRMLWSTGYEDYEINDLDFFIDQFKCLDKVKD